MKVYVVVVVLFKTGDQVPVIPLLEAVGSGAIGLPLQIGAIAVKVGVIRLFTVIVIVVEVAH